MKKIHILLIASVCLSAIGSVEASGTIYWQSPLNRTMFTSDGKPWGRGFHFELGSFKNNFVPTTANTAQWATNWVPAQRIGLANANNNSFVGTYVFTNNPVPFTNGAKAYIWGFRGSEVSGEWFLAEKSDWKWFNAEDAPLPKTFSTGSANAIVGTINTNADAPFHIKTAAITNALPPVTSWPDWATEELGQVPTSGPSGDLNTNKITDAWEYALNSPTSGQTPNAAKWLQWAEVNGGKYLEIHIPRRRDHAASFTVEVTSDLVNGPWISGPEVTEIVADTPSALVVRDKIPLGQGADRRFMRVKVSVGS